MLNVSESTKQAYLMDSVHKTYRIWFPELKVGYDGSSIVKDSISVKESIISDNTVEFVGCLSSSLSIKIRDLTQTVKGKKIELYVKAGDTEEISLFKGIVDSAVIQSNRHFKEITAYDALYKLGDMDISDWYNGISYPTTIGTIRKSLMAKIGITDNNEVLPNDSISIPEKFYEPNELKAISVLKSICQINGCCGILGRDGKFKWIYLTPGYDRMYPEDTLYPSGDIIPISSGGSGQVWFHYYKDLKYEEYSVKPVDKLTIRKSEDEIGVTVGSGNNRYIIQNNMFVSKLEDSVKTTAANNILNKINLITYHPFTLKVQGLPYLEVGDIVSVDINGTVRTEGELGIDTFLVLSREISGDQILSDTYNAEGDEEQKTFITDIQAQLNDLKDNGGGGDLDDYYTADEVDDLVDTAVGDMEDYTDTAISSMEEPTGFKIVSCKSLPSTRDASTLYLIQGGVVIL